MEYGSDTPPTYQPAPPITVASLNPFEGYASLEQGIAYPGRVRTSKETGERGNVAVVARSRATTRGKSQIQLRSEPSNARTRSAACSGTGTGLRVAISISTAVWVPVTINVSSGSLYAATS